MPDALPRCRRVGWSEIDGWADRVAAAVRAADAVPATIVGLTRGGWVPARLLSDRLGTRRLVSMRAQHWGVTATPDGEAKITEGLSGPVAGEQVLVVDDITDTGASLRLAVDAVRVAGVARVESATFLHIARSEYVPTYSAEEIPRDAWVWIVFPWNYWEDLAALGRRAQVLGAARAQVRATLQTKCGLDVPDADLARVGIDP